MKRAKRFFWNLIVAMASVCLAGLAAHSLLQRRFTSPVDYFPNVEQDYSDEEIEEAFYREYYLRD